MPSTNNLIKKAKIGLYLYDMGMYPDLVREPTGVDRQPTGKIRGRSEFVRGRLGLDLNNRLASKRARVSGVREAHEAHKALICSSVKIPKGSLIKKFNLLQRRGEQRSSFMLLFSAF